MGSLNEQKFQVTWQTGPFPCKSKRSKVGRRTQVDNAPESGGYQEQL
jgi:hypothetical protein